MLIHENVKPYACSYCDRQFTQKSTRDVHLTKHTGYFLSIVQIFFDIYYFKYCLNNLLLL